MILTRRNDAGLARVHVQAAQVGDVEAVVETAAQGAGDRVGLLGDLLEQVVLVAAGVVVGGVPVDGQRLLRGLAGVAAEGVEAVGLQDGQLAVLQVDDLAGVPDQRGHVGGGEHLLLADAQHDRAAQPGHHDLAGAVRVDDGDAVRADDALQRPPDGVLQRVGLLDGAADQVGEDLGVGLAEELDALALEALPQRVGVLDDAVVDDRDALVGRQVRVGVDVARHAVGGPAGVPDARRALEAGRHHGREVGHAALDLAGLQRLRRDDGDARGVVAAVFEPLEPLQQNGRGVLRPDVGHDSAHRVHPP